MLRFRMQRPTEPKTPRPDYTSQYVVMRDGPRQGRLNTIPVRSCSRRGVLLVA